MESTVTEPVVTIVERKPFHEVIIGMIQHASSAELTTLGTLLLKVTIPKGHDEIISAWKNRCEDMKWAPDGTAYVANDIFLHKQQIEGGKKADTDNWEACRDL